MLFPTSGGVSLLWERIDASMFRGFSALPVIFLRKKNSEILAQRFERESQNVENADKEIISRNLMLTFDYLFLLFHSCSGFRTCDF